MKQLGIRFQDLRLQIVLLPARKLDVDHVDHADWRAYLIKRNALFVARLEDRKSPRSGL